MRSGLTPKRIADDVFEFDADTPAEAQALSDVLRATGIAEDVVAGLDRVAVRFDPSRLVEIESWLTSIEPPIPSAESTLSPINIEIRYGGIHGPDFERACAALKLSEDAFIEAHTAAVHTVAMIGFTPGFAYVSGLPRGFSTSRLDKPRPRVSAGSVGISSAYTGIYALNGPGGWPIIGHTNADLFCAEHDDPFLLMPGQRIRFRAI